MNHYQEILDKQEKKARYWDYFRKDDTRGQSLVKLVILGFAIIGVLVLIK